MTQQLEYRSSEVVGVSFPSRTIELVVMPYETETEVAYRGRVIREICSKGAYDGIERRGNRVRVNRDHDVTRTVGRAVCFHPSREEGLISELKISRTYLGDETLQLADDQVLDASAGFAVLDRPGAEVWETRDRRRLNHLWLGHIALTPEPAYESAKVLAVRSGALADLPEPPPNLEQLELQRLREEYASLDARYTR